MASLQTLSSRGELYVHSFTFKLREGHDMTRLRESWLQAVRRFEILRTSFHFAPLLGRWAQVIHSSEDFKWRSMESNDEEKIPVEVAKTLSFQEESDLARSPLYFNHVSRGDAEYLVVTMHHALYDGVSLPRLLAEVRNIYSGDTTASNPKQFQELVPDILAQELNGSKHWSQRLAGVTPYTFPRDNKDIGSAWRASRNIDIDLISLQRTCRRYHITTQCIGQVVWAKLLARFSNSSDVVFGQVVSGRALPGADEVLAPTFVRHDIALEALKSLTVLYSEYHSLPGAHTTRPNEQRVAAFDSTVECGWTTLAPCLSEVNSTAHQTKSYMRYALSVST